MSSYSDVLGTGMRNPTPADLGYFQGNPSSPGKLSDDGHIVLNPYNSLPAAQKATAVRLMLSQGGRDMENAKQMQKVQSNAQNIAAQGRGGDSVLVHMNPTELAALQQIGGAFGRDVTINPATGLPEAMSLTDILLGLGIGIAAAATGGAAGFAAAGAMGAGSGALGTAVGVGAGALAGGATSAGLNAAKAAIQHKDVGREALMGGLTGALGGGVGAAGAIGSLGEAAGTSAVAGTQPAAGSALITPASLANAPAGAQATGSGLGAIDVSKAAIPEGLANAPAAAPTPSPAGLETLQNKITPDFASAPSAAPAAPSDLNAVQKALTIDNPESGASKVWNNMVENPLSGSNKAVGMASLAAGSFNEQAEAAKKARAAGKKVMQDYRNEANSYMPAFGNSKATLMMAAGGTVAEVAGLPTLNKGYLNQQPMTNDYYPQAMIPQAQPLQSTQPIRHDPLLSEAYGGPVGLGYAEGGTTQFGAEGMLRGPGDGQSDGIAAFIHGDDGAQEPVRLAESEFVVPADVVAALGSGSSKAGASALYDMLNRVRKQAYGHTRQANPVDPSQVLPA